MALNRASDVLAADWLSQTHVRNYRNFSRVVIRFSSVVEVIFQKRVRVFHRGFQTREN